MEFGTIVQINVKPRIEGERGIPKLPVPYAKVLRTGVEGDYNVRRTEKKAGNPNRAVLILTLDRLLELNQQGWHVKPADLGENLTIAGLRYDSFELGQEYLVGEGVRLRIAEKCNPCTMLTVLPYIGKEKVDEFIACLVGRRGWYASVIEEGLLTEGDPIRRIS